MRLAVLQQINKINQIFYDDLGDEFSKTRGRVQPGVAAQIPAFINTASILDVGCGNGSFAHALESAGFSGHFSGIDLSQPLLRHAQANLPTNRYTFQQVDLTKPAWQFQGGDAIHDVITSFAVLHHIAGKDQRNLFFANIRARLADNGIFVFSVWQFLNSPKLTARILPWEDVGIPTKEVEEGDHLLDWRSGGKGIRYAHHYSQQELNDHAKSAGFRVVNSYFSDGTKGNLAIYQTWKKS